MKKIYYLISLFILSGFMAKSQCSLDSSNMQIGFWPADTSLHPIIQGLPYDTTAQLYMAPFVNDTTDTLRILSTQIDTIFGLPTGVTYTQSPASHSISPNGRVCFTFSGRTADTVGWYNFSFLGSVHIISAALGDTILTIADFNSVVVGYGYEAPVAYALRVVAPYVRPCMDIDSTYDNDTLINPGVYPVASDLPCIVQGVLYNQSVQGRIQTDTSVTIMGISVNFVVDSMQIDSILGLPTGITFGRSPAVILGGGFGCVNFAGTTTDTVGTYPLTAYGHAWLTASAAGQHFPYTVNGNLNGHSPFGGYYLRVVHTGDSCSLTIPPNGIKEYYNNLNAQISVFPNPNNGIFNLKINAASPVAGQIQIYDGIGRKLYEQPIDIIGLYTTTLDLSRFASGIYFLQVRTPQGVGTKKISIE
jgi:hypothetical protein